MVVIRNYCLAVSGAERAHGSDSLLLLRSPAPAARRRVVSLRIESCRVVSRRSVASAGARGEQPTSVKTNYVKCMLRFQRLLIIKCFIVFNKI